MIVCRYLHKISRLNQRLNTYFVGKGALTIVNIITCHYAARKKKSKNQKCESINKDVTSFIFFLQYLTIQFSIVIIFYHLCQHNI